jgi:hypothetical protein
MDLSAARMAVGGKFKRCSACYERTEGEEYDMALHDSDGMSCKYYLL